MDLNLNEFEALKNLPELITPKVFQHEVFKDELSKNNIYPFIKSTGIAIQIGRKMYVSKTAFINWLKKQTQMV